MSIIDFLSLGNCLCTAKKMLSYIIDSDGLEFLGT